MGGLLAESLVACELRLGATRQRMDVDEVVGRSIFVSSLTRWVLAHKRLVVAVWLVLAVVGFATAGKATDALSKSFALPGKEGYDVSQQIAQQYGSGGMSDPVVAVITLPG